MNSRISIPKEALAKYCRERGIRRLAVFGSALRDDFRADSDIDLLVEFEPDHIPTLFDIAAMERELSDLLGGRKVDLRTPQMSPDARAEASGIPWDKIIGMRHRLVHAYFEINLDILWKTVQEGLPPLITELEKLVPNEMD
jgi:predicted nucleotidyltransferase